MVVVGPTTGIVVDLSHRVDRILAALGTARLGALPHQRRGGIVTGREANQQPGQNNVSKAQHGESPAEVIEPGNGQEHGKRGQSTTASFIKGVLLAEGGVHAVRARGDIDHHRGAEYEGGDEDVEDVVDEHKAEEDAGDHDCVDVDQTKDEDAKAHAHYVLHDPVKRIGHGLDASQANNNPRNAQGISGSRTQDVDPLEVLSAAPRQVPKRV
mmetsp:Transcript_54939/g.116755  ORF Transcript_54939/g.116755 Transcript_54939/m.116755 type:complete len:212 (-) Transcript_54939:1578-2213(-)